MYTLYSVKLGEIYLTSSNIYLHFFTVKTFSQLRWHIPVIVALGRLRPDHQKFKASLYSVGRPCLKIKAKHSNDFLKIFWNVHYIVVILVTLLCKSTQELLILLSLSYNVVLFNQSLLILLSTLLSPASGNHHSTLSFFLWDQHSCNPLF
jgi:hypothetical protein